MFAGRRPGGRHVFQIAALLAIAAAVSAVQASAAPPRPGFVDPYEVAAQPPGDAEKPTLVGIGAPHVQPSRAPFGGFGRGFGFGSLGFAGLTLPDQRNADNGNQQTVTPPDQGLCTNGLQVLEPVNTVFAIYSRTGAQLSPVVALTPFFTGQHEIDRTASPPVFGPFVSDPKCYFDPELQRFFMTVLEIDRNPATGDFGTHSSVRIAVSKSPFATASRDGWFFYSVDTTNAGPTAENPSLPSHPGCPCFGDQPLIGADAYAFVVTTNEFPISEDGFNGAQIYAFDKVGLTQGHLKFQAIFGPIPLAENVSYSLQPATTPVPSQWNRSNNGTEYMLSALDFNATVDARIALWALTNTHSLQTSTPAVTLTAPAVLASEVYGQSPPATQKPGPYPLGQFLGEPEEQLNTNDDRMMQVVYADGKLWSGLNTVVSTAQVPSATSVHAGIAYFVVRPGATTPAMVTGTIAQQGYVALQTDDVMFPSIGVNAFGRGVMTFSLSGPDIYPSVGYTRIDEHGTGPVTVLAQGRKPADDFSGYPEFGGDGVARWGDYSAAVAAPDGAIMVAAEWTPGTFGFVPPSTTPPSYLANWGTFVANVVP